MRNRALLCVPMQLVALVTLPARLQLQLSGQKGEGSSHRSNGCAPRSGLFSKDVQVFWACKTSPSLLLQKIPPFAKLWGSQIVQKAKICEGKEFQIKVPT